MSLTRSTHLLLLLGDLDTPVLFNNKAGDTLVSLAGVDVGKDQKGFGLARVGDPPMCAIRVISTKCTRLGFFETNQDQALHLGSIENVVVSLELGSSLEGERVRSRARLGQTE